MFSRILSPLEQGARKPAVTETVLRTFSKIMSSTSNKYDLQSEPYVAPTWARGLKVPASRIKLANLSTPVHKWNLPGVPDGFEVYIKRDDMTGSTLSGNKVRKLEFLLADALDKGCRHIITCGGMQSNHCRAVAVAAVQLGLTAHLLLRTNIQDASETHCHGNIFLDRMAGAYLYMIPLKHAYVKSIKPKMEKLAQKIKEDTGEDSYLLCVGGSDSVGAFGYINCFQELIDQNVIEDIDDIVFACGSGGTGDGLAVANYLTNSKLGIHGITVCDNAQYFSEHMQENLHNLGLDSVKSTNLLEFVDGHKRLGYGITDQSDLDFIINVAMETGIMLDPTYTGKAVRGLVAELNNNPGRFRGKRILFLHTGGIFGLFDQRLDSTLVKKQSKTNRVYVWTELDSPPFSEDFKLTS